MIKDNEEKLVPATVGIGPKADKIVGQAAEKHNITKKEYIDSCVLLFNSLGLDPVDISSRENKALGRKLNTIKLFKELEKNLTTKFSETRNTYISFIRHMEENELKPINTKLNALEKMIKMESKTIALLNLKNTLVLMDLITDILVDSPNDRTLYFEKYMSKLK